MPATSQTVRYNRLCHLVNVDIASIVAIELFQFVQAKVQLHREKQTIFGLL